MDYDQLKELGFIKQPDGSYSRRPNKPVAARLSHAVAKPAFRPTLDRAEHGKEKGQERLTLRITRRAARLLDADNFAGGCKPLIDQVRYAGLIPDDSPDKVDITFTQQKVKKGEEGILIEISEQSLGSLD